MTDMRTVCQAGQSVHEVNVRSVYVPFGHLPQRNPEIHRLPLRISYGIWSHLFYFVNTVLLAHCTWRGSRGGFLLVSSPETALACMPTLCLHFSLQRRTEAGDGVLVFNVQQEFHFTSIPQCSSISPYDRISRIFRSRSHLFRKFCWLRCDSDHNMWGSCLVLKY